MARHLCYMSDATKNKKKIKALMKLIGEDAKPANFLEEDLKLSSSQISPFLKRINEVHKKKKYNRYHYFVEVSPPTKIQYGDEWIKIDEQKKDGKRIITVETSQGDEKEIVEEG